MVVRLPIALDTTSESWLKQQHRQQDRRRPERRRSKFRVAFLSLGLPDDRMVKKYSDPKAIRQARKTKKIDLLSAISWQNATSQQEESG
jgi:hypothetical protein